MGLPGTLFLLLKLLTGAGSGRVWQNPLIHGSSRVEPVGKPATRATVGDAAHHPDTGHAVMLRSLFGSPSDTPRVSYSNQGRCGYVHYRSAECNLDMYYEFGGGDVVASIDVPAPRDWTEKTGLPLERRAPILEAVGRLVARDQTTGGRGSHEVHDNWIYIKA